MTHSDKQDTAKPARNSTPLQRRTRKRNFLRLRLKGIAATLRSISRQDAFYPEQLLPFDVRELELAIAIVKRLDSKLEAAQKSDTFWNRVDRGDTIGHKN